MLTMTYFITMEINSRTRMSSLLKCMVREAEWGKFQKLEWLKKCEIDWSLIKWYWLRLVDLSIEASYYKQPKATNYII